MNFVKNQVRKLALKKALQTLREQKKRVESLDDETYINLFNTGMVINLKKVGENVLNILIKGTEKQLKKG